MKGHEDWEGGFLGMALTMGAGAVDEGRKRSWGRRGWVWLGGWAIEGGRGMGDGGWGMARGWWWKAMGCVNFCHGTLPFEYMEFAEPPEEILEKQGFLL